MNKSAILKQVDSNLKMFEGYLKSLKKKKSPLKTKKRVTPK